MSRTFIFAFQPCYGATGGGQGVAYRLYEANLKYSYLRNPVFVFGDRIIEGTNSVGVLAVKTRQSADDNIFMRFLKARLPGFLFTLKRRLDSRRRRKYIQTINEIYQFNNDDVYIFHDIQLCSPFIDMFDYEHVVFVNHSQGSVYYEWKVQRNRESKSLHKYFNKELANVYSKAERVCFPSFGAEEALRATEQDISRYLNNDRIRYLYNGISIDDSNVKTAEKASARTTTNEYRFITVAQLNYAKGVERIPSYLESLNKHGISFTWTIIGDGAQATILEKALEQSGIADRVTWIRNYVAHDLILNYLSESDFYILFHRYSIFDLTTLEAMHFGVIPILSNVGGNKEIVIDENGLLVEDFSEASGLINFIEKNDLKAVSRKNTMIQREKFSDEAFLKRYADLINELCPKTE